MLLHKLSLLSMALINIQLNLACELASPVCTTRHLYDPIAAAVAQAAALPQQRKPIKASVDLAADELSPMLALDRFCDGSTTIELDAITTRLALVSTHSGYDEVAARYPTTTSPHQLKPVTKDYRRGRALSTDAGLTGYRWQRDRFGNLVRDLWGNLVTSKQLLRLAPSDILVEPEINPQTILYTLKQAYKTVHDGTQISDSKTPS